MKGPLHCHNSTQEMIPQVYGSALTSMSNHDLKAYDKVTVRVLVPKLKVQGSIHRLT
jgi:hypothetical protein